MKSDLKSSKILFTKKKKEYSFLDWNVELIQKPSELMQKFKSLDIKNKTITNIRCVGLCYNLREDMLEEDGYNYYETKNNKDFETLSNYSNFLLDTPFSRHAEIDEVIILELDNKERFEIDFSEASSIKIGINTLDKNISYGTNANNADLNVVFSNCIGQKITGFEITMIDSFPEDYTGSHG